MIIFPQIFATNTHRDVIPNNLYLKHSISMAFRSFSTAVQFLFDEYYISTSRIPHAHIAVHSPQSFSSLLPKSHATLRSPPCIFLDSSLPPPLVTICPSTPASQHDPQDCQHQYLPQQPYLCVSLPVIICLAANKLERR